MRMTKNSSDVQIQIPITPHEFTKAAHAMSKLFDFSPISLLEPFASLPKEAYLSDYPKAANLQFAEAY